MTTPRVLIVLDGWGHREDGLDNAIAISDTPVWDRLWHNAPHTLISASGEDVGLPDGQMGNSEVGHMNLGAGRLIDQDLPRINKAVADGRLADNPAITDLADRLAASGGCLHIFGLLSPGGVHSHESHIFAAIEAAYQRGVRCVCLHAFLDGRDTPPKSAADSLARAQACFDALLRNQPHRQNRQGGIHSVSGRFYAMDRDQRWDRTAAAYHLLTEGAAPFSVASAAAALQAAYQRDESDEFVQPTRIGDAAPVSDGDGILFMNFRADRARQLSRAFLHDDFDGFRRAARPRLEGFVSLTEYAEDIPSSVAFPPQSVRNGLGEYLSAQGMTQLRIAETEKYAHVTFFFSGGRETPFVGEERILVPSPQVATYDLAPEMSAVEVTDQLVAAINDRRFDLIVCNYANGDMVGHTGDLHATRLAVECIDRCLGRIEQAVLAVGGECLITADHGNCEQMQDPGTGQAHTAHTSLPVPLVYIGKRTLRFAGKGALCDIAPTLLDLMDLKQPPEMSGRSLLDSQAAANP